MSTKVINIQQYCDFDIPCTAAIMTIPDGITKKALNELIEHLNARYGLTREVDDLITELKKYGFGTCKEYKLTVGGQL